jgi:hypothetical protein
MMESEVPRSHFVNHADVMVISDEPAKNVHKTQVANCTKVHMLNQYEDFLYVSCLSILILRAEIPVLTCRTLPTKREFNRGWRAKIRWSSGLRTLRRFQYDPKRADGEAGQYGVS